MNKQLTILSLLLLIGFTSAAYKCLQDTNGCTACITTKDACTACKAGWYLDSTSKQCKVCTIPGCSTCTDATTCTGVLTGYTLIGTTSFKCADGCLTCGGKTTADVICSKEALGFFLKSAVTGSTGGPIATACSIGCQICSNELPSTCSVPKPGFFFDVGLGKCVATNCLKCADKKETCTTCIDGFLLSKTIPPTCDACIPNCISCSDKVTCTTCITGYRYNSSATTKSCDACTVKSCILCVADATICDACPTGYSLVAKACIKCADFCSSCSVDGQCDTCNLTYLLHPQLKTCGNTCSSFCSIGCKTNGFQQCDGCDSGYGYVNKLSKDWSCGKCADNAQGSCPINGATKADNCIAGYTINSSNTCTICTTGTLAGCTTCSYIATVLTCSACGEGYYATPVLNLCISCTSSSNTGYDKYAKTCNYVSPTITVTACISGYVLYSGACYSCTAQSTLNTVKTTLFSSNAITCTVSYLLTILSCPKQYYLANNKCNALSATNCSTTGQITDTCAACDAGYYYTAANAATSSACLPFTATNCSTAGATSNICTSCKLGYYFTSANSALITACQALTPNCTTSSPASNVCTTCAQGYFFTTGGAGLCTIMSAGTKCTTSAPTTDVCTTCAQGYFFTTGGAGLCTLMTAGTKCTTSAPSTDVCTSCAAGYFFTTGGAGLCSLFTAGVGCSTASATTDVCTTCSAGYFFTTGGAGLCTAFSATGCTTSGTSTDVCTSCDATKYVFVNGKCVSCKSETSFATFAYKTTGFDSNASSCSLATLPTEVQPLTCTTGFIASNGYCISCSDQTSIPSGVTGNKTYCTTCSISSLVLSCSACDASHALYGGDCVSCDAQCNLGKCTSNGAGKCDSSSCKLGYGLNSTNNCVACPSSCSSCKINTQCDVCNTNFVLTTTYQCLPCADNCSQCSTGGQCTICQTGYYLSSNICKACYDTVKCTCTSGATLFDCSPINLWGKYFPSTVTLSSSTVIGTISPCVANCVLCFGGAFSDCLIAATKFFLDTAAITACPTGCDSCTGSTLDKCTVSAGWFKDTSVTPTVLKQCPTGCANCSVTGTGTAAVIACSACPTDSVKDTTVTTSYVCTFNCIANCDKCTTQDVAGCSACKATFTKGSTGCSAGASNTTTTNTTTTNAMLISVMFVSLIALLFLF